MGSVIFAFARAHSKKFKFIRSIRKIKIYLTLWPGTFKLGLE